MTALVVGLGGGAFVLVDRGATQPLKAADPATGVFRPVEASGAPCHGARKVSLEEAATAGRAPVLMPDHERASEADVDAVWLCGTSVSIHFSSGVRLISMRNEIPDPSAKFAERASADPDTYSIGSVRGTPAEFFHTDKYGAEDAAVSWVEGEWLYILTGKGHASIDEIEALAASLYRWEGGSDRG